MTADLVDSLDTVVVPSLIPADYGAVVELADRVVSTTGCRAFEINTGAPHGREAAPGNIALETETGRIVELVRAVRAVVDVSLWVKITGQTDDVAALAAAAFEGGADAVTLMGRHMGFLPNIVVYSRNIMLVRRTGEAAETLNAAPEPERNPAGSA